MGPVLPIGPFALPVRPLLLLLGLGWGWARAEREGRRWAWGKQAVADALWGLAAGYLAGRLAALPPHALSSPLDLLAGLRPTDPTLAPLPALGAAIAVTAWRWRRHRIPWRAGLDLAVPIGFALAIAWALGDWAEGRRYGTLTSIPWLGALGGGERHPVQLYEAGLGLLAFLLWEQGRLRLRAPGSAFLLALALYSGARWIAEGFRAESPLWWGFRVPQLLAFAGFLVGGWGLIWWESRFSFTGKREP